MELPEINKRIRQLIDYYANGIVKKFAENINLPQQTVNRLFVVDNRTSKYPIATTEILQKISEMYDIDDKWLLTGKGEMLKTTETPHLAIQSNDDDKNAVYLYDVSASARYGSFDELIHKNNIVGKYVIPNFKNIDFMIYVQGSSMYPKYNSGDIVACRILHESRFIQWGKPYVVATREHGLLVKRLRKSEQLDHITAVSDNPRYDPFDIPTDEVLGLALVVGVLRLE